MRRMSEVSEELRGVNIARCRSELIGQCRDLCKNSDRVVPDCGCNGE